MMRLVALAFISTAVTVLTYNDGHTGLLIALGLWWFGMLVFGDLLLGREGTAAQTLWGVGVGGAVYVLGLTDVPESVGREHWLVIVAVSTLVMGGASFLKAMLEKSRRRDTAKEG
ncbi:MAG TPA: hypothetical protein VI076_02850, partial [Actinopolymorphaceae bacterium]